MDTDQQEADENEIPKLLLAKYAGNMIWRWLHCTATSPRGLCKHPEQSVAEVQKTETSDYTVGTTEA